VIGKNSKTTKTAGGSFFIGTVLKKHPVFIAAALAFAAWPGSERLHMVKTIVEVPVEEMFKK
jgi:hypothetical protein